MHAVMSTFIMNINKVIRGFTASDIPQNNVKIVEDEFKLYAARKRHHVVHLNLNSVHRHST
jgi:hypothetical protein